MPPTATCSAHDARFFLAGADLRAGQDRCAALGAWLLRQGLGPDRPLEVLCPNGMAHARAALAALWVSVTVAPMAPACALRLPEGGKLRSVVAAIAGENRAELDALVFQLWEACRRVAGLAAGVPAAHVARHPAVLEAVQAALVAAGGRVADSSTRVCRVVLQLQPPSFEQGEITEKGSLNQRRVVHLRSADAEAACAAEPGENVICTPREPH